MTEATKPTIALLPCLWCGTAASFHSGPVHWGQYVATVWCSTEDCPIEDCSEYADSEQDARVAAAATWSTRTTSGSAHIAEERDRLAAENARLVGAKPAGQVERETLMDLWRRIDDDQDGDPPSNAALADGLVRMFGEMATRVAELEEELQGAHFESVGGDL